jgi:hypothetical protein
MSRKNERPAEQEAIVTTIVGGRPPGCGTSVGNIPRGVEVLLKKASVDSAFKELLFRERANAALEISLELAPAEKAMISSISEKQLEMIIASTEVDPNHKAVFMGKVAASMLLLLGVATASVGCDNEYFCKGNTVAVPLPPVEEAVKEEKTQEPDKPDVITRGIRPNRPAGGNK